MRARSGGGIAMGRGLCDTAFHDQDLHEFEATQRDVTERGVIEP